MLLLHSSSTHSSLHPRRVCLRGRLLPVWEELTRVGLLLRANAYFHLWFCSRALRDALPLGVHVRSRCFRPLSLQLVLPVNKCPIIHVTDCLRLPFTARRIDVSRPAQSEVSRGLGGGWGGVGLFSLSCFVFIFLLLCLSAATLPHSRD